MEIIKTNIANIEENKKALYKLTKSSGVNVKDIEPDKSHKVESYALYTDVKVDREGAVKEQKVLTIVLATGEKLQTISKTFIDEFMDIVDIMGDEDFSIVTRKGLSKGGREFVSCELDCD